jgi:hypothetical protein
MTAPYEWNPMPHTLDVKCPRCAQQAYFEFAEVVRIKEKKDVQFFKDSDQFEYLLCQNRLGHKWHAALFFPGLHGRTVNTIRELPDGYAPSEWAHSKYLYRSSNRDVGSVDCSQCGLRQIHHLKWPQDAYYQIEYKGQILWAFDRETANELKEYILSKDRDRAKFQWQFFLLHVPAIFLKQNAREEIVKKLEKLLR